MGKILNSYEKDAEISKDIQDNMEEYVKDACSATLEVANTIIKLVESYGFQNEQWFLDFMDKLNEISVKY